MTTISELKTDLEARMNKTLEALGRSFSGLRTGRANPALLDNIHVEAYGSTVPLNQVGNVGVPESRMLSVQVWDKNLVKNVEKAIRESSLGLNPMCDGTLLRIPVPPLSEERRLEMVKIASKYAEESKVSVRNIRRDGMDEIKEMEKSGEISEDDKRNYEDIVQKLTDAMIVKIDEHLKVKEQEIKQV